MQRTEMILVLVVAGFALVGVVGAAVWLWLRRRHAPQRRLDEAWRQIDDEPDKALKSLQDLVADLEKKAGKDKPKLVKAYFGIALCHIKLKHFDSAAEAEENARGYGDLTAENLRLLCKAYCEDTSAVTLPDGAIDAFTRYVLLSEAEQVEKTAKGLRKLLQQVLQVPDEASEADLDRAVRRGQSILALGLKEAWVYSSLGKLHYRGGRMPEAIKNLKKTLALAPNQTDDLLILGKAYRKSGDHRAARATLIQAYQQDEEHDPYTAFEAGRACLRWSDEPLTAEESRGAPNQTPVEAARELLQVATKKAADYAPGWMEFGLALIRLGQLDDAAQALEKAAKLDPDLPGLHCALGQCALARGDKVKARAALSRAQQLYPNLIETVRLAGDLAYADANYAEALSQYRRLSASGRLDPVLIERLAHCHLETGTPAKTVELLADRSLDKAHVRLLLGRALARQEHWADALKTLQALPAPQMSPEYRYYLAAALAANGKHAEAEAIFNDLAPLPKWQSKVQRQLGHLKLITGDFAAAKQFYAMNHQPASALDLGRLALVQRDIKTAYHYFDRAAKQANAPSASRAGLAMSKALTGQTNAYDDLLQDPDLAPWANEQIGASFFKGHQFVEALEKLEKAARGRQRLASALICQLAGSYLALNRYSDALPHLVELSRRYPRLAAVRHNLALCRFHLGQGHFRRGQWDLARQEWNRAAHLLKPLLPEQATGIHQLELEAAYRTVMEILQSENRAEFQKAQNMCEIGCKEAPTDSRWWFGAGLAAAQLDSQTRAAECFIAARKQDKTRTSFSLGASLSFMAMERHEQARLTLEKTLELAEADPDPKHALFPVATRFALTMTHAKKKQWTQAAKILEPLLHHPMIKSSTRIQPADVAQAMVAYYGLAGDKERAADLAKKYLDGQGSLGNLLIGLVQAEGGDYSGAAETLELAYQQDPNPKIADVLVSCLLAEAARLVLEGDLKAAGPLVRRVLKIAPDHKAAQKLQAALSFGSRLKDLDAKQLEKTIQECEVLVEQSDAGSAQLIRTLGVLHHRKALQAEKNEKNTDEAWSACLKYWKKRILNNEGFWTQFAQEYNEGKDKRGRIKPDDLTKWRKELPGDLARDHAAYTAHFLRKWEKKGMKRHLNLIWDWAPDWAPPAEFLLKELQNIDESKLDFISEIMGQVKNENLRKVLGEVTAGFWNRKGLDKMDLAIDQANRAINLSNTLVNLVNSLGSAAHAIRGQVIDGLHTARNLLNNAKDNCREALRFVEKASGLAPHNQVFRENCTKIRDEQRKINENYDTINGLLRQIG